MKIRNETLYDLLWMSMRYCIGRSTIASAMHAGQVGQIIYDNPEALSENQKIHLSNLICEQIVDQLSWNKFVILEGSNRNPGWDPYTAMLLEMQKCEDPESTQYIINMSRMCVTDCKPIDFKKESYQRPDSDYIDMIPWIKLMRALDPAYHIRVKAELGEQTVDDICVMYPAKGADGLYFAAYQPVKHILCCGCDQQYYVAPEYIKSVEKV